VAHAGSAALLHTWLTGPGEASRQQEPHRANLIDYGPALGPRLGSLLGRGNRWPPPQHDFVAAQVKAHLDSGKHPNYAGMVKELGG
jgi:hypothetical protein